MKYLLAALLCALFFSIANQSTPGINDDNQLTYIFAFIIIVYMLGKRYAPKIILNIKVKNRLKKLTKKYDDQDTAIKIINGTVWEGQTYEQVLDTFGKPNKTSSKKLKTKNTEEWKFKTGAREELKVVFENDVVCSWTHKTW